MHQPVPVPAGVAIRCRQADGTRPGERLPFPSPGMLGQSSERCQRRKLSRVPSRSALNGGATDCKEGLTFKNQCAALIQTDKSLGTRLDTGRRRRSRLSARQRHAGTPAAIAVRRSTLSAACRILRGSDLLPFAERSRRNTAPLRRVQRGCL